ncbi:hypothetical protein VNO78_15886 [Psophocarpus tetragonolobus]|uniref:Uncharacterized protein n=1 Tax=Psophocarpus tetragonolobus TaxID=3891 RepID=A0AAN9SHA7_PSOTE
MSFHIYQPYFLGALCIAMFLVSIGLVTCFESPLISCKELYKDDAMCYKQCLKKGFAKGGSCKPFVQSFLCCCNK